MVRTEADGLCSPERIGPVDLSAPCPKSKPENNPTTAAIVQKKRSLTPILKEESSPPRKARPKSIPQPDEASLKIASVERAPLPAAFDSALRNHLEVLKTASQSQGAPFLASFARSGAFPCVASDPTLDENNSAALQRPFNLDRSTWQLVPDSSRATWPAEEQQRRSEPVRGVSGWGACRHHPCSTQETDPQKNRPPAGGPMVRS